MGGEWIEAHCAACGVQIFIDRETWERALLLGIEPPWLLWLCKRCKGDLADDQAGIR